MGFGRRAAGFGPWDVGFTIPIALLMDPGSMDLRGSRSFYFRCATE